MAKQKKIGKKTFQLLTDVTGHLYRETCKELGYNTERLHILLSNKKITQSEFQERKEKIDELYCKKLCKIETKLLEAIIEAHVLGVIKRTPRTLDMVQKELLERVLNEDKQRDDS